jgi:hypothetical protein
VIGSVADVLVRAARPAVAVAVVRLAVATGALAQTSPQWVTESTVTVGRPGDFGFDDSFLARRG